MGRADTHVDLVPYDPRWVERFERTRAELEQVFPGAVIEHIGSTSVPGLASKDTIDVAVGVADVSTALSTSIIDALAALGFDYMSEAFDDPDHAFVRRVVNDHRTDHVHVIRLDSETFRKHLVFRDYLRTNPDALRRYEEAKLDLAVRFHDDRDAYVVNKEPVVNALLTEADNERGTPVQS